MKHKLMMSICLIVLLSGCVKVGNEYSIIAGADVAKTQEYAERMDKARGTSAYKAFADDPDDIVFANVGFGYRAIVEEKDGDFCKVRIKDTNIEGYIPCEDLL